MNLESSQFGQLLTLGSRQASKLAHVVTSKVVPSLTTITGNPVVVLRKVVACSAYVIIL